MAALLLCGLSGGLSAAPVALRVGHQLCWAVTPERSVAPAAQDFRCDGWPRHFQDRALWLRADVRGDGFPEGADLLIHETRFDHLSVRFGYADGAGMDGGSVARGDAGHHWRIAGQLAFEAPQRPAALDSVTLRFDHLQSARLLRIRLLGAGDSAREASLVAAIVGGALTLLLLGALYSLSMAVAVRRAAMAWHGAWASAVFLWGLIWSQLALIVVPGIAGTTAAELCTVLATAAIGCATSCAIATIPRAMVPGWARGLVFALGWSVAGLGLLSVTLPGDTLDLVGSVMGVLTLATLSAVILLIAVAWRRGSTEARDYALAWLLPMVVLALTQVADLGDSLFGGGAQIAEIAACAFQTVWISVAMTLRLSRMRFERDAAFAARNEMNELARRDPLTGLLNRRGFLDATNAVLAGRGRFGLLLIDIDHFKTVNDRHGHDVGDEVLKRVADRLRQWEGDVCFAGRLGGEEFLLGVRELGPRPLLLFADRVREGLAACRHDALLGTDMAVTVSIGIADSDMGRSFDALYRAADGALYEAKHLGRNRIAGRLLQNVPAGAMFGPA